MTGTSAADTQAFIARLQAQYRYYIAGKEDGLFASVGNLIADDSHYNLFKIIRTQEATQLRAIQTSTNDSNTKLKLSGAARLGFLREAINALQAVSQTGKPQQVTKAIGTLETELNSAATDYTSGMAGETPTAKDKGILASFTQMNEALKGMLYAQQPRLLHANVYYSVDSINAFKMIAGTKAAITAALAATGSSAAATTTTSTDTSSTTGSSGSGVDITV